MSNRLIKINNLTDYHLNDFLDCPSSFWQKHLLKKEKDVYDWRDLVEYTVNQTVRDFFALPPSSRSVCCVLHSIHRHWNKKIDLFHSREHYFHVLGLMTSNLIQYLRNIKHMDTPFYTNQKLSVSIPEWDLSLTLTIPLALLEEKSLIIKKIMVTNNPEFTRAWTLFTIFFCHHAFNIIPEKIEFFNILTGAVELIQHPNTMDLERAKNYIGFLMETIKDPNVYSNLPRIIN